MYYDFAKEYIREALKNILAFTLKFDSNLLYYSNFKLTIWIWDLLLCLLDLKELSLDFNFTLKYIPWQIIDKLKVINLYGL